MTTFSTIFSRSKLAIIFSVLAFVFLPLRASAIYVPTAVMVDVPYTTKEYGLDVAIKVAAGIAQDVLIESIRAWILNGFQGNPSFVLNPRELLGRVQDEAGTVFTQQLLNSELCGVFLPKVEFKIAKESWDLGDDTFNTQTEIDRKTECLLDNLITSGNIEDYYQDGGFVTQGGFDPLLQAVFNPANDPREVSDYMAGIQRERQNKAAAEAKEEVALGLGFEGLKECAPGQGTLGVDCRFTLIKTPAKTIGAALEKSVFQSIDEIAGADEISELIVLAIKQLTMQALSGAGLR